MFSSLTYNIHSMPYARQFCIKKKVLMLWCLAWKWKQQQQQQSLWRASWRRIYFNLILLCLMCDCNAGNSFSLTTLAEHSFSLALAVFLLWCGFRSRMKLLHSSFLTLSIQVLLSSYCNFHCFFLSEDVILAGEILLQDARHKLCCC